MSFLSMIVAAAGRSERFGVGDNKVFLSLGSKPILAYTLDMVEESPAVQEVVVVTREEDLERCTRLVQERGYGKIKKIVPGGEERQDSIAAGLGEIAMEAELVAVHDGARPFITSDLLKKVIETARSTGAAVAAIPVKDTIKQARPDRTVARTFERQYLWSVQTPQVFRRDWLAEAYHYAAAIDRRATDDATLVEMLGKPVTIVVGDERNIKITTPGDLLLAEAFLGGERPDADRLWF